MKIRAADRADIDAVLALWRAAGSAPAVNESVEGLQALLEGGPGQVAILQFLFLGGQLKGGPPRCSSKP